MANSSKINWRRVLAGGLLAGLIIDVLEAGVNHFVIGPRFAQEMRALGKVMEPTPGKAVFFLSLGFILGLVSIWLYAAIRPRFGPGPGTAIYAALAVWFLYGLLPHLLLGFLEIFSMRLELEMSFLLLIWHIIATLAGAWVYKEEAGTAVATA
jgi:hypothetical protein